MSDYRRWRVAGGTYFFTVVTYQRRRCLTTPTARQALRKAFETERLRRPFSVMAIVLLPDHLHTVWELPPGDSDYATRWRRIKTLFTRSEAMRDRSGVNLSPSRQKRKEQAVWQRRFYEHACRNEDDVKRCVDYVHLNPVKHQLVKRVRDWPWSSFHRYVKLGEYSIDWGGSVEWFGDEFKWAE